MSLPNIPDPVGWLRRIPGVRAVVPRSLRPRIKAWSFLRWIRQQPDRRYMEREILPRLSGRQPLNILFVGVEQYTRHYSKWFSAPGSHYWTLDVRAEAVAFGAGERHVVGSVLDADCLFPKSSMDVVFLNGVFGWGVDQVSDQDKTIAALHMVLKPDGLLLLGWNTDRSADPVALPEIRRRFAPLTDGDSHDRITFPGSTHVYQFFRATLVTYTS